MNAPDCSAPTPLARPRHHHSPQGFTCLCAHLRTCSIALTSWAQALRPAHTPCPMWRTQDRGCAVHLHRTALQLPTRQLWPYTWPSITGCTLSASGLVLDVCTCTCVHAPLPGRHVFSARITSTPQPRLHAYAVWQTVISWQLVCLTDLVAGGELFTGMT